MVTTQNLIFGETCVFGNGGTAANVQYSSWSCTKIQNSSGSGGGSGWVDVPLTDTADFDTSCEYRFDMDFVADDVNRKHMNSTKMVGYG
ncbi:hypothetical protein H6768_00005 [Candidatus Peribacteria bacterium]|nr:hypothetical protein [Candidatus Peribacteria bacterium]